MRSRWLSVALALIVLGSRSALAQRLHFATDEPKPGTGKVALKLAAEAREKFDAMRERGAATPADQAKQAYFAAAGTLLEAGEAKGVSGTFLVASGTGMMRSADGVFALLDARKLDDNAARLLASDLSKIVQSMPEDSGALDRALRDTFANVLQTGESGSDGGLWPWPEITGEAAPVWPDFVRFGDEAGALVVLRDRCELGGKWASFRPGARAMMRLVTDASWLLGREAQMSSGVYKRWKAELVRSAREVVQEETGETGLARLNRLALLGRIFAMLDAFAPDPGAKQLEKALAARVEFMPDEPEAGNIAGLRRLEAWLDQASDRGALIDEKKVVRQLRPAVRSVADLARRSQSELFESLTRVAGEPRDAGDPGVMASVNLFSENIELLRLLQRASDAIGEPSGGDSVARESAKPLTDALLKMSKDVADVRKRDRAMAGLRGLAADVADLQELPGEKLLASKDPAMERLLGDKSASVLALIERERAAWRREVGGKAGASAGGEGHAQRLRAVAIVLGLAVDAGRCKEIAADSGSAVTWWGGWWLEGAALGHLASDALSAVPLLLESVEQSEPGAALAAAESGAREHAVVLLAARVARGFDGTPRVTFDDLTRLRAVATGTPDERTVALATWREQLAVVCRYAGENSAGNTEARAFASKRANDLLEAMKRTGSDR